MRIQPMKAKHCCVLLRTGMFVRCWSIMRMENRCRGGDDSCFRRSFPLVKRSKVGRFHFPVSVS